MERREGGRCEHGKQTHPGERDLLQQKREQKKAAELAETSGDGITRYCSRLIPTQRPSRVRRPRPARVQTNPDSSVDPNLLSNHPKE